MSKIYLPSEYVDMPCKVVNSNYIRVYDNNNYSTYYDIYFNQDYMVKSGTTSYTQNVSCDIINEYTDEIFYRNDFDKILIIFLILFIFIIKYPFKIVFRFFRRFL